jgi:hypothetical protein
VCVHSPQVTSKNSIILVLSANVGFKSASASTFGLVLGGGVIVEGPYLITGVLTAQRYCNSPEKLLPGLLEDAPLTLKQMLWFQNGGSLTVCGEDSNRE